MEVDGKSGDTSRDEVSRQVRSETNHCKPSILQFLQLQFCASLLIIRPQSGPVQYRNISSSEALSLVGFVEFPCLSNSAQDDELGPPLGIGLNNGVDGIGGGDIVAVEGSVDLGPEPSNVGKHGRTGVGKLNLTGPLGGDVFSEAKRIPNFSSSLNTDSAHSIEVGCSLEAGCSLWGGLGGKSLYCRITFHSLIIIRKHTEQHENKEKNSSIDRGSRKRTSLTWHALENFQGYQYFNDKLRLSYLRTEAEATRAERAMNFIFKQ